jgi:hypothetical protein
MVFLPRGKLWGLVLLVCICLGAPSWSLAQGEEGQAFPKTSPGYKDQADQDRFIGPPTSGPILVTGAVPMGKGNFAIQPYWYLTFQGSQFNNDWRTVSAGQDLISLNNAITLYYGFTENFWVSIFWSYYIYSRAYNIQNPAPGQGRTAELGDTGPLSITLRYRFLQQQRFRPTVTGLFTLGFPSARGTKVSPGTLPAAISGSRNWGFTWGLNLHLAARPVILYANLWYFMATIDKGERIIDGGIALESFNPRDQIKFNLAAEIPLRWEGGPWVLLFEMTSFWELGPIFPPGPNGNPSAKVTTLAGIEYILSPAWRFALGCSFDLFGKNTTKNFTPTFTIYKPLKLFKRKRLQG